MVSRDLVPMRERIAGRRWTGKPLQIAVDDAPGTTEATQHPGSAADALPDVPSRPAICRAERDVAQWGA